jgi:phytoene synthase
MKNHGKTFFWATAFLEKRTADDLYSVYAFCRRIDDLIDNNQSNDTSYEDFFKVKDAWVDDKFTGAFDELKSIDEKFMPREKVLKEFLKGQTSDISHKQPKNISELLIYCYQVAGAVGLMVCDVIGIRDPRLKYFAIDLGIAMQLTNICRDIKEDASINRIYLPKDMINLKLESYINPTEEELKRINLARNDLLDLANKYYESGEKGISHLPSKTARAVLIASKLYQYIGTKIINGEISYQANRVYLNIFEKLKITTKLLFKLNRRKNIEIHDEMLHLSILELPDAHIK